MIPYTRLYVDPTADLMSQARKKEPFRYSKAVMIEHERGKFYYYHYNTIG